MTKDVIGVNAGIIWHILDKAVDIPLKRLQKSSGINVQDFYMAIGWLSRENKIHFFEKNEEYYICRVE